MFRNLVSVAILGFVCAAMSYADDAKKSGNASSRDNAGGKIDRSKIFEKMDANLDGKVTKGEYTKFMESVADRIPGGKGGNAAENAAKRFDAMDANKDSVVSKEEFEKADTGRTGGSSGKGKGPGAKSAKPRKKAAGKN